MSNFNYNQLLKFLYFEGYSDSYEESEYLIENMNDDEFESLCEEVYVNNLLITHLIDEGYAETKKSAEVIIRNMSEEWMNSIIESKSDKVSTKGRNK